MDIRDILKSFDTLSEGESTVHKAGPGGYGNKHGTDDVTDQYGKPIGRVSLGKLGAKNEPKRGKGRPPNPDKAQSYDSSALSKAMGMGKAPKPSGKPSVKHSLKEYFDQLDQALNEGDQIEIKPASQMPKQLGQMTQPGQPQQMAGQPQKNTQVIAQGDKTLGTVDNPTLAAQIKQSIGKGEMTLMPDEQGMAEDGANWIKGAIKHPGAFTKKASSHGMTPKEFANKVLAHKADYPAKTEKQAQLAKTLGKMHEAEAPQHFAQSSPLSTANRGVLEGEGDFGKAIGNLNGWYEVDPDQPNTRQYKFDDQEDEYYADGTVIQDLKTGKIKVEFNDKAGEYGGNNINDTFNSIGDAMNALGTLTTQKRYSGGKSYSRDSLASKSLAGPDDVYKTDRAGKIGTLTKSRMGNMKASSQYTMRGGPKGVLPEGKKGVNPFAKKDDKDEKKGAAPKKGVNPFAKKEVKEAAKPDFLDLDKDGNKKEPMKTAAKDKKKVKEGMEHHLQAARLEGKSHALRKMPYNCTHDDMEEARCYHDGFKEGLDECYGQMPILGRTAVGEMGQGPEVDTMASYGADDMGMDEGNAFTAGLAKTAKGSSFSLGGNKFTDRSSYDSKLSEFAFEALDKQLNALLESEEKVSEGMTVSISKGQQGAPDSVSVSAQDGEADQLLSIIKTAGLGLFGGEEKGFSAPEGGAGAHGGINVVDDHDGMMSLMKKLAGGGDMPSSNDFADEQGEAHGEEEHMHGHEETCESCGGMMEENHQCGSGQESVMGEDETEDQREFEVAEANAPDSGADNTDADVAGNAAANSALATADAGADEEEGQVYSSPTNEAEDETGEEAGKKKEEETVAESFANLYKKLAYLSEESTEKEDEKAEKAAKKVAKDIEYDEGHKGKDDDKAEEAGKKVKKDIEYDDKKDKKVDESYANSADDTFEADIEFMTNIISGGLNKQKSTGQTTIPVIAGQGMRTGIDGKKDIKESAMLNESVNDWKKLAGIK